MARSDPRVFTIPPGTPFLPTLVDALFSGRFGAIANPAKDPLALADITILVPTRRAARSLHAEILERLGGRAAILPAIRPIGDVDEEDQILEAAADDPDGRLVLPEAISRLDRLLVLTRLTLAWGRAVRRELLSLSEDDRVLVPASAADAFHLAGDLARLIDDIETTGIAWDKLETLVPDDLARYWQISLDFLRIVGEQWPAFLSERSLADPSVRRDHLLRAAAARLEASPPRGLVIAAGSTGSIPAVAELLSVIAHLPNGAVVMPGIDTELDANGWVAIGGLAAPARSAPGHPQYGLKHLIETIGVERDAIVPLGAMTPDMAERVRLISEAMRPAETTEDWATAPPVAASAIGDVALVVARTEQEEAVAIALAMREAIREPGRTAALVTPDRRLAGRVAIELGRFGLSVDDSAGRPLMTSSPGTLARLLVAAAKSNGAPVDLLALAKHPLASFGLGRAACRAAIDILDLVLFRGQLLSDGLDGLVEALDRAEADLPTARYAPAAVKRLGATEWQAARDLAGRMAEAIEPLSRLMEGVSASDAKAMTSAVVAALNLVAARDDGSADVLWAEESGQALATLLAGLMSDDAQALDMAGYEYPGFLDATMAGVGVPARPGSDPRLFIWGTLEARLQQVDLMVLGGLDEGVWPSETRTDPWLSRSMRAELGLEAPERKLGQSAHDFTSALSAGKVVVTRAERRGGTPTVAARWLQRLLARLGKSEAKALAGRGLRYLDWARALDRTARPVPIRRPAPLPPLEARPRRLSVTEIETLIRDPYAIYARRILKLDPLDPIGVVPDVALRGTLIHEALGDFIQEWKGPFDASALTALTIIGRRVFARIEAFPAVYALWWPRFLVIAEWFIGWEASRASVAHRHAEIGGAWAFPAPAGEFKLTGRADRVDIRLDGSLEILDFKTGSPPSAKQLSTGLAPQLALEVAMARGGGFDQVEAGVSVSTLGWIGLGKVGKGDPFSSAVTKDKTADELGDEARARLYSLIEAFDDPKRAYVSRARPMFETRFESPYDHLARIREWALGDAEEGGE
ncbi:double-strand break repair protein AddB [Kaistia defluvii]|uniref:double-strand break repair protein AddB n=1 Tax=Kaistia defluvii TaxID=410841 RepID=UPI00225A7432|nr:double-strand break repair protein AddB [Kaistia defluvii]MCX5520599.1 double-strand break repair protein AddB [Kaistia defluvii]